MNTRYLSKLRIGFCHDWTRGVVHSCTLHLSLCSIYSLHPVLFGVTGQKGLELLLSGDTLKFASSKWAKHLQSTANMHILTFTLWHTLSTSFYIFLPLSTTFDYEAMKSTQPESLDASLHLGQTCCPGKMLCPEARLHSNAKICADMLRCPKFLTDYDMRGDQN